MKKSVFLTLVLGLLFGLSACAQKPITNEAPVKLEEKPEKVTRDEPVKVGETAPDFSLTTTKDEKITLSEIKKFTMLVFYRGHW